MACRNSSCVDSFLATPTTAKFWGSNLSCARLYNEGTSKRRVRSPEAPKMTRTQGSPWRAEVVPSSCMAVAASASLIVSPPLAASGALDMAAELVTHGRQDLLSVRVLLPRPKARIERCRENIGRDSFFDSRHDSPTAFAGILHKTGIARQTGIFNHGHGSQIQ